MGTYKYSIKYKGIFAGRGLTVVATNIQDEIIKMEPTVWASVM